MNHLAEKRRFLYRAFFPDGLDVCKRLGMVPTSDDGAISEFRFAKRELDELPEEAKVAAMRSVEWFIQAMTAAGQDLSDPNQNYDVSDWRLRDGRGDLLGLGIAMLIKGIEMGQEMARKENAT